MQGGTTRFKKGHKTILIEEKVCKSCNKKYRPNTNGQKYCGSHSGKSGCSWEHHLIQKKENRRRCYLRQIKDPDYIRGGHLKRKYKLTLEDYSKLSENQNHLCAICGSSETGYQIKFMYIDHNHSTGKVRGLLCNKCNFGLGNFKDNISILQSAIKYLEKYENN